MSRNLTTARVEHVGRACRSALLEVLGTARRWSSGELVAWFSGPHAAATVAAGCPRLLRHQIPELSLAPEPLAAAVVQARLALLDLLVGRSARAARAEMVIGCIRDGLVTRLHDAEGREGWTPERVPGVPLVDHLRAIAAADCLMRPQDYEFKLAYCGRCDRLSFAACRACGRPSVTDGPRIVD